MIEKAPAVFPLSEYRRRLSAAQSSMKERGVAALVVSEEANIAYLTGFEARSGDLKGLVVALGSEEPVFILRWMDVAAALHQTYLEPSAVIGYPEALMLKPDVNGIDAIIDHLIDAGMAEESIGLELGVLSHLSVEKFKARLPKARLVNCTGDTARVRIVKSDLEIALMHEAAAIADAGISRALEIIRPGIREADAIAEIVATLARGAAGKPGSWIATPFMATSPRTAAAHINWSEDILHDASQINLEIAGTRHGYTAPICRTFFMSKPGDFMKRVHDAQCAGLEAGLAMIRPGRTCSEVADAIHSAIREFGLTKASRCGYPIGIHWLERNSASLEVGDLTILEPNMVFHLHLGNWSTGGDFGYVISESIRVTESGVEVLTKSPRQYFEYPFDA